jgi:hypothetical protein
MNDPTRIALIDESAIERCHTGDPAGWKSECPCRLSVDEPKGTRCSRCWTRTRTTVGQPDLDRHTRPGTPGDPSR